MFIAERLNQPDVTSFRAILCQKTQESLASEYICTHGQYYKPQHDNSPRATKWRWVWLIKSTPPILVINMERTCPKL
jgi:hypothetical protein